MGAAAWWERARRADRIYCGIVNVIGTHILCDKWACCCDLGLFQSTEPSSALLCRSRSAGIFRPIPIYTRQDARPSQAVTKIKAEIGWEYRP